MRAPIVISFTAFELSTLLVAVTALLFLAVFLAYDEGRYRERRRAREQARLDAARRPLRLVSKGAA